MPIDDRFNKNKEQDNKPQSADKGSGGAATGSGNKPATPAARAPAPPNPRGPMPPAPRGLPPVMQSQTKTIPPKTQPLKPEKEPEDK